MNASLAEAIAAIGQCGATSVAICFLHAYRNPAHEIAAAERLARELPEVSVSRSSDVLPQIKEYERVSTTVVNAYVAPIVRHYLDRAGAAADRRRLQGLALHHALAWRHGAGGGGRAARGGNGTVGAGGRHVRLPSLRANCSAFRISSPSTWAAPRPIFP